MLMTLHENGASDNARKRRALFERFARNLESVREHPGVYLEPDLGQDHILCPICFQFFGCAALSLEYDNHLSLEHVPPHSLGGKAEILTCKTCNNRDGTELDKHLTNKIRADNFLSCTSQEELTATFRPDAGLDIPVRVKLQPGPSFDIRYDPLHSNPVSIASLHQLEASDNLSAIQLRIRLEFIGNRVEVALLRIAYLSAFARFGYGFLVNPNLETIRQQIIRPSEQMQTRWEIFKWSFPDDMLGVSIICEPPGLRAFLVVFDLSRDGVSYRYGVLLPGPTAPGLDVYRRAAELRDKAEEPIDQLRLKLIPNYAFVDDPNAAFASHAYWNECCQ